MMYHPEALPQRRKCFEHGEKVDVVVQDKKRYMAVFSGLTQDEKHANVRFLSGTWRGESLIFLIDQIVEVSGPFENRKN